MKLEDATQLDWAKVERAAARIIEMCRGAYFTAPEVLDVHHSYVSGVAEQLNVIASALLISTPGSR